MSSPSSTGLCQAEFCRKSVSAIAASALSVISTTPFDVIKIRMQAQAAAGSISFTSQSFIPRFAFSTCPNLCNAACLSQSRLAALCPPECYIYISTMDAFNKIARQEGIAGLWRGAREGFMMAVPVVGLYLPLYDYSLERMSSLGVIAPVIAGSFSRTVAIFFVAPLEILRTRLQAMQSSGRSGIGITRLDAYDWGQGRSWLHRISTLWRGYGATVARDVPFTAVYWGLLEPMRKRLLAENGEERTLTNVLVANSVAGATSGVIASAVTTPMDVVKTRLQLTQATSQRTSGFFQTLKQIYQIEGLRSLFSGIGPRTMRAAPSCAIVLSTYEIFKKIL